MSLTSERRIMERARLAADPRHPHKLASTERCPVCYAQNEIIREGRAAVWPLALWPDVSGMSPERARSALGIYG